MARLDRIVGDVLELGRRDRMQTEYLHLPEFCEQFLDSFSSFQGVAPGIIDLIAETGTGICSTARICTRSCGICWIMRCATAGIFPEAFVCQVKAGNAAGAGGTARHRRWRRRARRASGRRYSNRSSPRIISAPDSGCSLPGVVRGERCQPRSCARGGLRPFHSCWEKRYAVARSDRRTRRIEPRRWSSMTSRISAN